MKIKLHKNDLPNSLKLGGAIAIDTEAMGLNHQRDRLCLVQLSNCLLYTSDAADE